MVPGARRPDRADWSPDVGWIADVIMIEPVIVAIAASALSAVVIAAARRRHADSPREERRNMPEEGDPPRDPQRMLVQEWRDGRLVIIGTCVIDDATSFDGSEVWTADGAGDVRD